MYFRSQHVPLASQISNNVPLSEWSLGSDTSINVVVESECSCARRRRVRLTIETRVKDADAIKLSAAASRNRVFVIETQGGVSTRC